MTVTEIIVKYKCECGKVDVIEVKPEDVRVEMKYICGSWEGMEEPEAIEFGNKTCECGHFGYIDIPQ